jgi:hypothetical protein
MTALPLDDRRWALRTGMLVKLRTATGKTVVMRVVRNPEMGRDFPIVWVSWRGKGIPWPLAGVIARVVKTRAREPVTQCPNCGRDVVSAHYKKKDPEQYGRYLTRGTKGMCWGCLYRSRRQIAGAPRHYRRGTA